MSALDTIATLGAGAYILTVAVNGNAGKMVDLAKRDKAFLKWLIALAILWYMYNTEILGKEMTLILTMVFVGLFITSGAKITEGFAEFWKFLGE